MVVTTKQAQLAAQRKAEILRELDRIREEVEAYSTTRAGWGHCGDLSAVLQGLDNLHMVGRAYKRETGK